MNRSLYNFNLVIGVLSTFLLLTKLPVHVLRFFYPPLSAVIHGSLCILYITAACFQAGSDTTDSRHPQRGPPWYITKSCNVAYSRSNVGYCQQAKALFALTVIVIFIYFVQTIVAIMSCFVTKEEKEAWRQRQQEKREEKDAEERALREYEEIINSPTFAPPLTFPGAAYTPGMVPQHQPHFFASHAQYQSLNDTSPSSASDLPFRNWETPTKSSSFSNGGLVSVNVAETEESPHQPEQEQPYFPPPPKKATK